MSPVPGRKWLSRFYSTGSTQNPLQRPYVVRTIASPSRGRTKHIPRYPRNLHARGHITLDTAIFQASHFFVAATPGFP